MESDLQQAHAVRTPFVPFCATLAYIFVYQSSAAIQQELDIKISLVSYYGIFA